MYNAEEVLNGLMNHHLDKLREEHDKTAHLPKLGTRNWSPQRMVIDVSGEATTISRALSMGLNPHVIFIRKDGWALCAPREFERVAYEMWKDEWTHFVYSPNTEWVPIEKY